MQKQIKPYRRNCDIEMTDGFPEGMHRIALGIEYVGHLFHGFQSQPHDANTVQTALERALSSIADEPITLVCAGRTDAGVHATNQVVHFDTIAVRGETAWLRGANAKLPDGVAIRWAQEVSPFFHSRFSAQHRTYRYIIYNAVTHSALLKHFVTWDRRQLDTHAMYQASQVLIGQHDFSAFRASQCQAKNAVRNIHYITLSRQDDFIVLEIQATAFLYHMVRNIVGVLTAIGAGDQPVSWAQEVLDGKNRQAAGVTASPDGLYLVDVCYEKAHNLSLRPKGPYFLAS